MPRKVKMKNKKKKGEDLSEGEKEEDKGLAGDEESDEGFDDLEEESY
ncbi:MAG TPA: hypothetical protein VJ142_01135 [Candidatus Nanoarchaeia archaeon]|nr:hypothetical protein [Candidatus Nanoarchaeia archaeon]